MLQYTPTQNGWPFQRTDFKAITKDPITISGQAAYAMSLPEWMFARGATRFENIDRGSPRAVAFTAAFELILFTLNVIYNKINDPVASWEDYPVRVYLEALAHKHDPDVIVEHRLIIVEKEGADISFSDTFATAWQNVNSHLLPDGTFPDPEKTAKKNPKNVNSAGNAKEFNVYELYKHIHDKEALTIICGSLLGIAMTQEVRQKLSTERPINDIDNYLHPRKQFHMKHAFAKTSPDVCWYQRDMGNYGVITDSHVRIKFPNQDLLFRILPQFWNITRFMTRLFPCVQENRLDVKWREHIKTIAREVKMMDAEKAAQTEARVLKTRCALAGALGNAEDNESMGSLARRRRVDVNNDVGSVAGDDNDDDDDPFFNMDAIQNRLHGLNDDAIGMDADNADALIAGLSIYNRRGDAQGNLRQDGGFSLETFGNVREMTPEEEQDNHVLLGFADVQQARTNVFLDDFIGLGLKLPFKEQAYILKKRFEDDPEELARQMNTLKDVTFDKFERYCMGNNDNVSNTQAKLNQFWIDNKLENMHFELPMADPTLSEFDNFLIWMTEGAGLYEGIATNQALFTFIWVNMYSIFDRTPTVHTNMYIHGDAGVGKSHIAERAMHNCLRSTIEDVTSESTLHNTINATSSDNCLFNEDASLKQYFDKGNGADARKRYEMSAQKTIRKVLEYVEDEWGNRSRKTITYENKAPTTFVECGNEKEGDLGSDLITSKNALISRYIFVYVRQHNNVARKIGDSREPIMSVEEFRKINIRAHCIRGWYAKLADIMEGHNHIDMQAFENCIPILREQMRSLGLDYASNRTEYMMRKYAMGCAVFEQYLIHHCVPTGKHFGKPFNIKQLRDWMPVCSVNICIHTFGRFVDSYIPPAMQYTLRFLRNRLETCIKDHTKKIRFPGKHISRNDPLFQVAGAYMNGGNFANNMNPNMKGGGGGGGGGGPFFLPQPNLHMANIPDEDDDGGTENGLEGKNREFDGTFVCFGDETYKSMSDMIFVKSKNDSIIYSAASIEQCLYALKHLAVISHKYVFLSLDQDLPVIKDSVPIDFHEAGVRTSRFGLLVNYGLICEDGMYDDIVGRCIAALEFDKTPRQDFLTGVTNDDYPWLYNRVTLKPNKNKPMVLRNTKYITDYTLISLFGGIDRSAVPKDCSVMFNRFSVDMDTHCIMSALRANKPVGEISLNTAMRLHPLERQKTLIKHYRAQIDSKTPSLVTGRQYGFAKYPDFAKSELDTYKNNAKAILTGDASSILPMHIQTDVWIGRNENPISEEEKEELVNAMNNCYSDMENIAAGMIAHKPGDFIHSFHQMQITDGAEAGAIPNEDVFQSRNLHVQKVTDLHKVMNEPIKDFALAKRTHEEIYAGRQNTQHAFEGGSEGHAVPVALHDKRRRHNEREGSEQFDLDGSENSSRQDVPLLSPDEAIAAVMGRARPAQQQASPVRQELSWHNSPQAPSLSLPSQRSSHRSSHRSPRQSSQRSSQRSSQQSSARSSARSSASRQSSSIRSSVVLDISDD